MTLSPLARTPSPSYPPRAAQGRRGLGLWARRLGAAAAGALLLGAGGCYGATRYSSDPEVVEDGDGGEVEPSEDPAEPLPAPPRLEPLPAPDDDPEPEECVPEARLSGMMAPPNLFACEPDPAPAFTAPMYIGAGELCSEGPAWARFEVGEPGRYRVTLQPSGEGALLAVLDPEGAEVVSLGPEPSCVDLDMGSGIWTLRAEGPSPDAPWAGHFELYVDAPPADG